MIHRLSPSLKLNFKMRVSFALWTAAALCACTSPAPKSSIYEGSTADEAALSSPIPPTAKGFTIPNVHVVHRRNGTIYRGQQPKKKVSELKAAGVHKILIFKNETKTEVRDEEKLLLAIGYRSSDIENIPFRWKEFGDLGLACVQTLTGLRSLVRNTENGLTTYLHCTVGEDRTGYLAGLYRILVEGTPVAEAFREELCEKGYGAGDPQKPAAVVAAIDRELTPLFVYMGAQIKAGVINRKTLDKPQSFIEVCGRPVRPFDFDNDKWTCAPSSKARL